MIGAMMVLAMRFEADVLQHDDLVIPVHLLEGALQQRHRVLVVAAEEFGIGAHDPVGRAEQALALGVVAGPADQRADRLERLLARRAPHRAPAASGADFLDIAFVLPGYRLRSPSDLLSSRETAPAALLPATGPAGFVQLNDNEPVRRPQLSRVVGCGVSSEKAGTCTRKFSPARVSIS